MEDKKEAEEPKETPVTSNENSQDSEFSSKSEKNEAPENCNNKNNLESEEINEDEREKLKGDAIGDTLYSERFVLKTLMELKEMDMEQKLDTSMEKKLEMLWDMTIEKAVIKLLLEYSVIDLFTNIIDESMDERLTEILLGIIGNMSCYSETRRQLCNNDIAMASILTQIENSDPLILKQLMRLLHSAIIFENSGDELLWFKHFQANDGFVEKFSYILSNSTSNTLLMSSFEAMNAICGKFAIIECQKGSEKDSSFPQLFVKKCLVEGLIEAFKQVISLNVETMTEGSTDFIPSNNQQKFMNLFLELHNTISQYPISFDAYKDSMTEFHKCIARILLPLTQKMYLLPLSSTHQGIIENINDIIQALGDPFNEQCFCNMVIIWDLIEEDKNKDRSNSDWEDDDDSNIVDSDDLSMSVLEFITRTANTSTPENLTVAVKSLNMNLALKLFERINDNDEAEDEIKLVIEKMKESIKKIWMIDI